MSQSDQEMSTTELVSARARRLGRWLMRRAGRVWGADLLPPRAADQRARVRQIQAARFEPGARPPVERAGAARVASLRHFRVLFVVTPGIVEGHCMRYRAYNVMEGLRLVGVDTELVDGARLPERLDEALAFDLIVLVRRRWSPETAAILEFAERHRIAVVCDLDDYVFDDEVIPHSEYLQMIPPDAARSIINEFREMVRRCRYYTGSTPYLVDRAAQLGASSYRIPNGLNRAQLEQSRRSLEAIDRNGTRPGPSLGYFSGTRTHQNDFATIAPVITRLLGEFPTLRLVVAGDFDMATFPGFQPFADRVEARPFVDWTDLPREIARVDINLIPLVVNPFTEGKSELKYYEAAILKIPSVASPTGVFRQCITHGDNGLLASSPDEWYGALRGLIVDKAERDQIGMRAYRHAIDHYLPGAIGAAAARTYAQILVDHRHRQGIADDEPAIVVLFRSWRQAVASRSGALSLCRHLAQVGARVTALILEPPATRDRGQYKALVSELVADCEGMTLQVGGEIPGADVLLATDTETAIAALRYRDRVRWATYLVSEYDPASIARLADRERLIGPRGPEIDLLAFDPIVARLLDADRLGPIRRLPEWIDGDRAPEDWRAEPGAILVIAPEAPLPGELWSELAAALARVGADHQDVAISLRFGAVACDPAESACLPGVPRIDEAAFAEALLGRPLCVVLAPAGGSPRVHELLAAACPVIIVGRPGQPGDDAIAAVPGTLDVAPRSAEIARAISALLIDRVWLGALATDRSEYVRTLARPIDAARALLDLYRSIARGQDRTRDTDTPSVPLAYPGGSGPRAIDRPVESSRFESDTYVPDRRAG